MSWYILPEDTNGNLALEDEDVASRKQTKKRKGKASSKKASSVSLLFMFLLKC
jgi:hypothetical protein